MIPAAGALLFLRGPLRCPTVRGSRWGPAPLVIILVLVRVAEVVVVGLGHFRAKVESELFAAFRKRVRAAVDPAGAAGRATDALRGLTTRQTGQAPLGQRDQTPECPSSLLPRDRQRRSGSGPRSDPDAGDARLQLGRSPKKSRRALPGPRGHLQLLGCWECRVHVSYCAGGLETRGRAARP